MNLYEKNQTGSSHHHFALCKKTFQSEKKKHFQEYEDLRQKLRSCELSKKSLIQNHEAEIEKLKETEEKNLKKLK